MVAAAAETVARPIFEAVDPAEIDVSNAAAAVIDVRMTGAKATGDKVIGDRASAASINPRPLLQKDSSQA